MAKYTVRIQLVGAAPEEYKPLWKALGERFRDYASPKAGEKLSLPNGTYIFEGDESWDQVLELAQKAAGKTGRKAEILVAQSSGIWFSGLNPYKPESDKKPA